MSNKRCKSDNFESHNSLKLSYSNIQSLCLNFVECELFLESNTPDVTNFDNMLTLAISK